MELCNINVIKALMSDAGINFRKEFGQNFLINPMIPEDIADMCCDREDSLIVEIGPGVGCLTDALAKRYERVVAIEIDKGLIPILEKTMAEYDNVTVINADVMEVDLAALVECHKATLYVLKIFILGLSTRLGEEFPHYYMSDHF
jgi:16S rRNA (adenine1518-N6/adenine1519-N6)-dimethyltransferase